MITATDFKALFPEFSEESDTRIDLFIPIAQLSVNENVWGAMTDPATAFLTAHILSMANRGGSGAAGPVTMEKVGDLQRGYGDLGSTLKSELATTPYGLEYLRLRNQLLVTPMLVC